jgi:hypothetical protein
MLGDTEQNYVMGRYSIDGTNEGVDNIEPSDDIESESLKILRMLRNENSDNFEVNLYVLKYNKVFTSACTSIIKWSLLTIIGFLFVIAAFICFANSNRTNYWILHSLWHIFAMSSTILFIMNRNLIINLVMLYL